MRPGVYVDGTLSRPGRPLVQQLSDLGGQVTLEVQHGGLREPARQQLSPLLVGFWIPKTEHVVLVKDALGSIERLFLDKDVVGIDLPDRGRVGEGEFIGSDADDRAIFLVSSVDSLRFAPMKIPYASP